MTRTSGISSYNSFSSQSSDKLLQILEYLAGQSAPLRLQDIAAALEMQQPTVLRYMNSLINQGYAYKDERTLRYILTWRICRLSHQVLSHTGLRDIVSPYLRELSYSFNCGACVAMRQDDELFYLDVVDNPGSAMNSLQRIGKNAPIHTTGSGKVLMAGLTEQHVKRIEERKGLERLTRNTIVELPVLLEELDRVRKQGYAMDDEECEEGVRCVSVPLYDYTGQLVAAISIFGPIDNLEEQRIQKEILPALLDTAKQISVRLGY